MFESIGSLNDHVRHVHAAKVLIFFSIVIVLED